MVKHCLKSQLPNTFTKRQEKKKIVVAGRDLLSNGQDFLLGQNVLELGSRDSFMTMYIMLNAT